MTELKALIKRLERANGHGVLIYPDMVPEVLRAMTQLAAIQAESAEKDREIEQLTKKATLNAFIKYDMKRACEELIDTEAALSRMEAERDHYRRKYEELGAEYTKLRADRAFRRGAQGEG